MVGTKKPPRIETLSNSQNTNHTLSGKEKWISQVRGPLKKEDKSENAALYCPVPVFFLSCVSQPLRGHSNMDYLSPIALSGSFSSSHIRSPWLNSSAPQNGT